MNEFMTMSEAAAFLGVSKQTLRGIIKRRDIKIISDAVDSRQKLVKRSEIEPLKSLTVRETVPDYRPDPAELAELLDRIERSDAALARGERISTDQVRAELARFKESLLKQKAIA